MNMERTHSNGWSKLCSRSGSMNSNPFAQVFLNMLNLWDSEEVSLPNLSIRPLGGLDLHMPTDLIDPLRQGKRRSNSICFCL